MILSPRRSNRRCSERRAQDREIAAVFARFGRGGVGRRAAGEQRGPLAGRAVAVDALDLDGRANLAVELGVAVSVLDEMAVDAVHSLFQMNIELVHGQAVAFRLGAVERGLLSGRGVPGAISFLELGSGSATAAIRAAVESLATGSPRWSSSLPCRSFLKTARKTQPCP